MVAAYMVYEFLIDNFSRLLLLVNVIKVFKNQQRIYQSSHNKLNQITHYRWGHMILILQDSHHFTFFVQYKGDPKTSAQVLKLIEDKTNNRIMILPGPAAS